MAALSKGDNTDLRVGQMSFTTELLGKILLSRALVQNGYFIIHSVNSPSLSAVIGDLAVLSSWSLSI